MYGSLKGYIVVVNVQQDIRTGIKVYSYSFCIFFQSQKTNTLHNINEVRSERNETTYKFLMHEDFL